MRFPSPRFTLRSLAVAVAVAGAACGAEVMRRRSARLDGLASTYAAWAEQVRGEAEELDRKHRRLAGCPNWASPEDKVGTLVRIEQERQAAEARAGRYECLHAKYARASRSPWLLVEPDPPEP